MIANSKVNVHAKIVERTREVHEQLHRHPLLSQLMSPHLQPETYATVLQAYQAFFTAAEKRREDLGCWQDFALRESVEALDTDISALRLESGNSLPNGFHWVSCPSSCLGSLYALLGSRHGGVHIAKRIAAHLPDLPCSFFSLPLEAATWRALLQELQAVGQLELEYEKLADGAEQTFCKLGEWVLSCAANRVTLGK